MSSSIPQTYEEGDGSRINLIRFNDRYAFDDDSQRILRKVNNTFILENSDYSKEYFDADGKITLIKDKYSNSIMQYEYEGNKLNEIKECLSF